MKKLKYWLPPLVSLGLTALYVLLQLPIEDSWLRVLCDGFTLPGLLFLLIGLLLWLTGKGALDGLGYLVQFIGRALIPGLSAKAPKTYLEYTQRPRRPLPLSSCFATGLASLTISLLLLALYYA